MTSLMARRSVHLGGIHLHKIFQLPVNANFNLHRVAEVALQSLLRHPVLLNTLKMIDVLFLDEVGQILSEMLTCLDIILSRTGIDSYVGCFRTSTQINTVIIFIAIECYD